MCDQASACTPRPRPQRIQEGATLDLPALRLQRWAVPVLATLLTAAGPVRAERLTKEDRQWLREVEVLILPQEEKVYRDLSAEERPELAPARAVGVADRVDDGARAAGVQLQRPRHRQHGDDRALWNARATTGMA